MSSQLPVEAARVLSRGQAESPTPSESQPAGVRIDLHCHSTFSVELVPALPRLRFYPLLTPEQIYRLAKQRGMNFVTITDHDTIDGCKAFLDTNGEVPDFIVGEEVSTTFPSDGMVIHINVYDHTEAQHREIQKLAGNVLELVPYLRSINRLFVLNHPTWNKYDLPTTRARVDEYLELFDVFEGINGARPLAHNAWVWSLVEARNRRRNPAGSAPPVLVAGSDSHSDLVGTTYTVSEGHDRRSLLASIAAGQAAMRGEMGSAASMLTETRQIINATLERYLSCSDSRLARAYWRLAAKFGRGIVAPLMIQRYYRRQDALLRDLVTIVQTIPPTSDSAERTISEECLSELESLVELSPV